MILAGHPRIFVFAVWFTTNATFYLREYADTSSFLAPMLWLYLMYSKIPSRPMLDHRVHEFSPLKSLL
jgi:hypothetical protein